MKKCHQKDLIFTFLEESISTFYLAILLQDVYIVLINFLLQLYVLTIFPSTFIICHLCS